MATDKLPDTPHDLLRGALKDLRAVMSDDAYEVNMSEWLYRPCAGAPCQVCLAGAVMALTLRTGSEVPYMHPLSLSDKGFLTHQDARKLVSLDAARRGDWWAFFRSFPGDTSAAAEYMSINFSKPPYFDMTPEAFLLFFDRAADAIEEFWSNSPETEGVPEND